MSVGGRVIEVMDCGDAVWVNTREQEWDADLSFKVLVNARRDLKRALAAREDA